VSLPWSVAFAVDRAGRNADAGSGLSAMLHQDVLAGRDAAQLPPRCSRENPGGELVAVLGALLLDRAKPAPISTPFTALIPIIAEASRNRAGVDRLAQPTGTPLATTSRRAPRNHPRHAARP